eukprot:CAMPEP_0119471890 /NCGR_PEP_ID=MMETSP1344-20130328/4173_1 /TAXON_ID=236787 /ORGANISM="Florenciella parvula, Strain CCMP2471" /LENGTH=63 /DNA_ID=CAMNT_0007504739 /DNA_START=67 /DNA_END=258 /DNA_ORIENTATION=+
MNRRRGVNMQAVEEQRAELIRAAYERFLDGADEGFVAYQDIDGDSENDDDHQERDREDKYFDY